MNHHQFPLLVVVLLALFIGIPLLLLVLYTVGIQYQRESWWKWARCVCAIFAVVGLVVDVIANLTVLSVLFLESPRISGKEGEIVEWTFSSRLERLVLEETWRTGIAIDIALLLNFIAPRSHPHIHSVLLVTGR